MGDTIDSPAVLRVCEEQQEQEQEQEQGIRRSRVWIGGLLREAVAAAAAAAAGRRRWRSGLGGLGGSRRLLPDHSRRIRRCAADPRPPTSCCWRTRWSTSRKCGGQG